MRFGLFGGPRTEVGEQASDSQIYDLHAQRPAIVAVTDRRSANSRQATPGDVAARALIACLAYRRRRMIALRFL
jgi:hypothetical protein